MSEAFKTIAARIDNAERAFVEAVMRVSGCTKEEAERVTALYLKERIAKLDPVSGRISVKHGAFLEPGTIENAIAMAND